MGRRWRTGSLPGVSLVVSLAWLLGLAPVASGASAESLEVFDACWSRVRRSFYDRNLHDVDWSAVRDAYRPVAAEVPVGDVLRTVLNGMLAELQASHTTVIPESVYRQLTAELRGRRSLRFGVLLEEIDGHLFVRDQFFGGPAERAGIQRGDRVLSIDGRPPSHSEALVSAGYDPSLGGGAMYFFAPGMDQSLELEIQSDPQGITRRRVGLEPRVMSGLDSARNSVRVIEKDGFRIGTIHFPYCQRGAAELLEEMLRDELRRCDGLVIDLRGRGGYLDEAKRILRPFENRSWSKPLAFLIDDRTRSAKEVMAHLVRRNRLGVLVGQRTEGAVLGANFFRLPDGSYLELAITDVPVSGGIRLEGVGVEADLEVEDPLPYVTGRDPIFETGLEAVRHALQSRRARSRGPF